MPNQSTTSSILNIINTHHETTTSKYLYGALMLVQMTGLLSNPVAGLLTILTFFDMVNGSYRKAQQLERDKNINSYAPEKLPGVMIFAMVLSIMMTALSTSLMGKIQGNRFNLSDESLLSGKLTLAMGSFLLMRAKIIAPAYQASYRLFGKMEHDILEEAKLFNNPASARR